MKRLSIPLVCVCLGGAAAFADDEIDVPSGLNIEFHEMIWDQPGQGLTYRFRFLAPDIGLNSDQMDYEVIERDMAHLCNEFALPRIAAGGPVPNQIVVSIANQITEFGQPAPDVTQVFEAYSVEDEICVWEPF